MRYVTILLQSIAKSHFKRILDPEHKQPYITLDAIFALAGLTIADGLVRFNLKRSHGDYDLTLAGLEPREGIWSPWNVSLRIAKQLDVFVQLRGLFMEKHAWSLDDGDRILHKCVHYPLDCHSMLISSD